MGQTLQRAQRCVKCERVETFTGEKGEYRVVNQRIPIITWTCQSCGTQVVSETADVRQANV